ncbi:MAG TPA: VWA domain-containing protein [Cyclobacteriaceae bacterium]|nr:VWA domain-containing protein [Cyclobacteriaceae bacterium]
MPYLLRFAFISALIFYHPDLSAQKVAQQLPEKTRILFLLDASGSMNASWEKNQTRMQAAKKLLAELIDSLQENKNLELALRVYGHQFTVEQRNCEDSKLEVPFAANNHQRLLQTLQRIQPKGVTPIAYSLQQSAKDFPQSSGYRNILILITDGIESCAADPCKVALELQRKGVFLKPFIIGLGLEGQKAFDCMGSYFDANNDQTFRQALNDAIEKTFSKTSVSIELLNGAGRPTESNVNVSFINKLTGQASYEFVHYLDGKGKPDSVQVDPVLDYDIKVSTLPAVYVDNVNIKHGQHNVIRIPAAQGHLIVNQEGRKNPGFDVIVREPGKSETLKMQKAEESVKYLAGTYELEVHTLPKRYYTVKLLADRNNMISLPTPGLVNLNTNANGYGSLYEMLPDGSEEWVMHLDENKSRMTMVLQPGFYKIAFRVKSAPGSKFTSVKTFEVKPGTPLNINLFD